jgi:hypothetical protein
MLSMIGHPSGGKPLMMDVRQSGSGSEHSVPDVVQSGLEVAGPIAASGAAVAGVLRQWWHRDDAKK